MQAEGFAPARYPFESQNLGKSDAPPPPPRSLAQSDAPTTHRNVPADRPGALKSQKTVVFLLFVAIAGSQMSQDED